MMKRVNQLLLAITLPSLCGVPALSNVAMAQSSPIKIIDLGRASEFNLVAFGDFLPPFYSSFTHAVAIEGNMQLNDFGFALDIADDAPVISAYIGGDFSYQQGRIFGGSVLVGGSAGGVVSSVRNTLSPNQLIADNVDVGIDFDIWQTELQANAQAWSLLPSTGISEFKYGSSYFLTGDCESDLQVFILDGALLNQTRDLRLECIPDDAAVLLNISGDQSGISFLATTALRPFREKTLFNFYEATQLEFKYTEVNGSILAPSANVIDATGELYGNAIVKSWFGPMTLKWAPFEGYNTELTDCEGPVLP